MAPKQMMRKKKESMSHRNCVYIHTETKTRPRCRYRPAHTPTRSVRCGATALEGAGA